MAIWTDSNHILRCIWPATASGFNMMDLQKRVTVLLSERCVLATASTLPIGNL